MNRSYIVLISILVILAVAIGGFALYRSTTRKPESIPTQHPIVTPPPPTDNSAPPPPPPLSEEDQIAATNTLPLTITVPQDHAQISTPSVTVSGTTAPNADVAVNDKDLKADAKGQFTTTITLEEGENYILVVASDETGASEKDLTLTYTPTK